MYERRAVDRGDEVAEHEPWASERSLVGGHGTFEQPGGEIADMEGIARHHPRGPVEVARR